MKEFLIKDYFPKYVKSQERNRELEGGCSFKNITGWYCPGCGGTRAVISLLNGHFFKCICYHPIVFYLALLIGIYVLRYMAAAFFAIFKGQKNALLKLVYICWLCDSLC